MTYAELLNMLPTDQLDSNVSVENFKGGVDLLDVEFDGEGGVWLAPDSSGVTYFTLSTYLSGSQLDCQILIKTPYGMVPADVAVTPNGVVLAID